MTQPGATIRPQPGAQEAFLSCPADIAIYGGAAGGGKSHALLMEPIRHLRNPRFGCVLFRRTTPELRAEGGLWSSSEQLYPMLGGTGLRHSMRWRFPSGASISFSHMEADSDRYRWLGSQIPLIGFDELQAFTEDQFFFLLARNRSMCGIRPYVRATCNPDPDSFVARLVSWWVDSETGLAIKERSGVIRWFIRQGDDLVWADTREELVDRHGEGTEPKSLTFIPASVYENKALMASDPGYLANLKALPRVERERLLDGNWKIRANAGTVFKRQWFGIVDSAPIGTVRRVRYWDRAATEPNAKNPDPDFTVGLRISRDASGIFYVEDVQRFRGTPAKVMDRIKQTAAADGTAVPIVLERDPAQAGAVEADMYVKELAGYAVRAIAVRKSKEERAMPASAQAEQGRVKVVRGRWNEAFLSELENFPDGSHDDEVDAFAGALNHLCSIPKIMCA